MSLPTRMLLLMLMKRINSANKINILIWFTRHRGQKSLFTVVQTQKLVQNFPTSCLYPVKYYIRSDIISDQTLKITNPIFEIRDFECPIGCNVFTGYGRELKGQKKRRNFSQEIVKWWSSVRYLTFCLSFTCERIVP
jgi:hypothetical protein